MEALEFSCEQINFYYQPKGHLPFKFTIRNKSTTTAYYKFKLTTPRFYLLKPDRGFIEPGQTINIEITLHAQGVSKAENDKVKCFYRPVRGKQEPPSGWEHDEIQSYSVRFPIVVNDLPEEMRIIDENVKGSQVKSLANSKFDTGRGGRAKQAQMQSPLESSIREKEAKLQSLKTQVESLRRNKSAPDGSIWNKEYLIVAGAGLIIGLISSLWI